MILEPTVQPTELLLHLMDKFPPFDPSWDAPARAAWLEGFCQLLDMIGGRTLPAPAPVWQEACPEHMLPDRPYFNSPRPVPAGEAEALPAPAKRRPSTANGKTTTAHIATMRRLAEEGKSNRSVAEATGLPLTTVAYHMVRLRKEVASSVAGDSFPGPDSTGSQP